MGTCQKKTLTGFLAVLSLLDYCTGHQGDGEATGSTDSLIPKEAEVEKDRSNSDAIFLLASPDLF